MKFVALLTALVAAIVQESLGRTEWNVTVFTGDISTYSKVYLQIFGETNFTDYQLLDHDGPDFWRDTEDNFMLTSSDLGSPSIVRVSILDYDDWYLKKIEINKPGDDKLMRYKFESSLADGLPTRVFIHGKAVDTEWSIRVHTKTVSEGAKLWSLNALLKIFGPKGDTTEQMALFDTEVLRDDEAREKAKEVEAGQMDEFKYMDIDVGNPIFIRVWVEGEVEEWCPEKIELQKSGYDTWIVYDFRSKCLKGGESWKEKEHFIYADPSTFPAPDESSSGKLQSTGLLLSAGLGLCLMVAFM